MIKLDNVSKFYYSKGVIASGFSKVSIEFKLGEFVAIVGESGSGKSTLLNVISGLDTYEEGEMYVNGLETSHYTEKDLEEYRRKYVGNIFQNFNLVNSYTVYQNIELVLLLNGNKKKDIKKKVIDLIKKVNLYKFRNTKVSKLSGGQKQRVAIARALAKDTPLIIADEPTGNLDSKSAKEVIDTLHEIAKNKLVIIVTHNFEQVENYVTRVVKMHDGKILEDKVIKEPDNKIKIKESQYQNITLPNKIRLATRNTFNIFIKFALIFIVYAFITFFCVQQYANFKSQQYRASHSGYNNIFYNATNNRIVIKKKDKTPFTENDYKKINKIANVDYIYKYDLLVDNKIDFYDQKMENWFYSSAKDIKNFKDELIKGEMPKNKNEVILSVEEDSYDYYSINENNNILGEYLYNQYNKEKYKIVGIAVKKVDESNLYNIDYGFDIYTTDETLYNLYFDVLLDNTKIDYYMNGKITETSNLYRIRPSEKVNKGNMVISSNNNYLCPYDNCVNKKINIKVNQLNYADELTLTVNKVYNKNNYKDLTGSTDYEYENGTVYISLDDYENLFVRGIYQSSVFAFNEHDVDEIVKHLNKYGYDTLAIKDTLINEGDSQIITIVNTIITIILSVSIFYVSYFVISLILKSRNVYFSTIRILGANKKISKDLLIIELLVDSNLAYLCYLILLFLVKNDIIVSPLLKNDVFSSVFTYLGILDFIILYIILNLLSLLISLRFSKKLFKKSVISTINEEV